MVGKPRKMTKAFLAALQKARRRPTPDTHPKDGDVKQAPLGSGRKQVQIPPKEPSNDIS